VRLPDLTFTDALRGHIELTQQFWTGAGVGKIQCFWMIECCGEVTQTTSQDGEVDPDVTTAAEFRRLGLEEHDPRDSIGAW